MKMAEMHPTALEQELLGIRQLLWGPEIKPDIFKRWSQGFSFSASEPSALEQAQGGPCAVIAPIQAFLLKNLILKYKDLSFREQITTPDQQNFQLVTALSEILDQCDSNSKYCVVYLNSECKISESSCETAGTGSELNGVLSDQTTTATSTEPPEVSDFLNPTRFHENLKVHLFTDLELVKKFYLDNITQLKLQFGILLFLYSVMATRTLERVQSDSSNDPEEPLIDNTYGYGSQSLINLMITGRATTYVWDHEQDVGGLKLTGLEKQSQVGFITIMEHLRYCTVGSFYKNPMHPVWVVGSDTHLTVLFSTELRLVSPETKLEQARRIFKLYDPYGNNFISAPLLKDVLESLDLVSEDAYVDLMKRRLDPENLGIILLNNFMEEFFPKEENPMPDMFTLVHYNGLAQSNPGGQVKYRIGECILLESDLRAVNESNLMLTVLQTKWPNIEARWLDNGIPSLN